MSNDMDWRGRIKAGWTQKNSKDLTKTHLNSWHLLELLMDLDITMNHWNSLDLDLLNPMQLTRSLRRKGKAPRAKGQSPAL